MAEDVKKEEEKVEKSETVTEDQLNKAISMLEDIIKAASEEEMEEKEPEKDEPDEGLAGVSGGSG